MNWIGTLIASGAFLMVMGLVALCFSPWWWKR
jgi:hypothetical protein